MTPCARCAGTVAPDGRCRDCGLAQSDFRAHDALTAWLGADAPDPRPRLRSHRPSGPGRVLLCTDGLSRHLADPADLRAMAGQGDCLHAARALVTRALTSGGHDDVTATLIPVRPPHPGLDVLVGSTVPVFSTQHPMRC
ncbi:PP2C family protein-serine/threonine phosphatase [Actinosynnema sp. CA-248983]